MAGENEKSGGGGETSNQDDRCAYDRYVGDEGAVSGREAVLEIKDTPEDGDEKFKEKLLELVGDCTKRRIEKGISEDEVLPEEEMRIALEVAIKYAREAIPAYREECRANVLCERLSELVNGLFDGNRGYNDEKGAWYRLVPSAAEALVVEVANVVMDGRDLGPTLKLLEEAYDNCEIPGNVVMNLERVIFDSRISLRVAVRKNALLAARMAEIIENEEVKAAQR